MKVIERSKELILNHELLIIVFFIYLIPRLISLGADISNYDASFWYPRMDNFTKNILEGDFQETYQKYHPGVTLLWLSGTSKYAFQELFELVLHFNTRFIPQQFIRLNAAAIFPLVFTISLLGALCYSLLSKITNKKLALIFSIMLSIEPFFLGVSKFLHLSGLGGMLSYASFLYCYYYYYLREKGSKKEFLLYISAILAGLGMLTKIDSALALTFNALIIVYFEMISPNPFKTKLILTIKKCAIYGLTAFFVFYILFPSMWVTPVWTLDTIIKEGLLEDAFDSNAQDTLSDVNKLFYPEAILLRNLPTTFILMLIGLVLTFVQARKKDATQIDKFALIGGALYTIFNVILLSLPSKANDRYITNFYPGIIVLSAYAFYYLYNLNKNLRIGLTALLVVVYALTLYRYYPVYSYYYTDLLGGPAGINNSGRMILKNRGEFYAQAAQYINNNDPKAVEKTVITDSREQIRTFQPFFYGSTYTNPKFMPKGADADYIVTRPEHEYLIPQDKCKQVASFGPKAPLKYDAIKLYSCEGIDNTYQDFKN